MTRQSAVGGRNKSSRFSAVGLSNISVREFSTSRFLEGFRIDDFHVHFEISGARVSTLVVRGALPSERKEAFRRQHLHVYPSPGCVLSAASLWRWLAKALLRAPSSRIPKSCLFCWRPDIDWVNS